MLTSKEWKHSAVIMFPSNMNTEPDNTYLPIGQIHIHSTARYLSNGTYVKSSALDLYLHQEREIGRPDSIIRISESGTWQLIDNYLFIHQTEIQELPVMKDSVLSTIQTQEIKERYVIEGQQSKRIDILSENSLLITST
ncbi:regulatory protein ToxS [Vibrio sp. JC009]|uniref:regulatory protein ToxS n=1 Tax=Vibrio sp. JC009 TaxID=2912314 RepID=UPI0023B053F0|nr:regulatory protein ToxS [Vibrio sp. JC009]WED25005.1 regulatory protein ToxS [Vibrio sp. JC009]